LKGNIMSSRLDRGRLWRLGAAAAAIAAILNVVILAIGRAAGVPFVVPSFTGVPATVAPPAVVFTVALWFVLGLLLTTFVAARQPRRLAAIQIVAAVVTVVSLVQPLIADADTATRIGLAIMHPVTGAAFILALRRLQAETATSENDVSEPTTAT
jgi:Family of unknown function (DUF6069)